MHTPSGSETIMKICVRFIFQLKLFPIQVIIMFLAICEIFASHFDIAWFYCISWNLFHFYCLFFLLRFMNAVNSHLAEKKNIKEARNEWKSHLGRGKWYWTRRVAGKGSKHCIRMHLGCKFPVRLEKVHLNSGILLRFYCASRFPDFNFFLAWFQLQNLISK